LSVLSKKILVVSAAVACLYLLLLLVAWGRFDGADVGQRLTAWLAEKPRCVLHLEETPRLALFPRPAVVLARSTLSGRDGKVAFASFTEARLNLAWGALLGGAPRVTGMVLHGVRADLGGAGVFNGGAANGNVLHLERAVLNIAGSAVDGEGSGSGLGLSDLRWRLQSAPAGQAHSLALGLNGLHGTEKFDLRLAIGALRQVPQGFAAEDVSLVAQWGHDAASFDVALRIPALAGDVATAQAEQAVLSVNHLWPSGRLTLTYSGAARLGVAGAWLAWPAARLEVNLLDGAKGELTHTWNGATRFEAAQARPQ